jgi:hypothetical protein
MISTAFCLILLHALIAVIVWGCAPWPLLAAVIAATWCALAVVAARTLVARLGGWWRPCACLALVLFPAVAGGTWDLLYFVHCTPRNEVACAVDQLWMTPILPFITWTPGWWWHGTAAYLWLLNAAGPVLFVGLTVIAWTKSASAGRPPAPDQNRSSQSEPASP